MSIINTIWINRKQILIYEWDDTIIPTTYIKINKKLADKYNDILKYIQKNVYKIISRCILQHRTQYIVTNSQEKWVFEGLKIFFPKYYRFITKYVKIISASDNYYYKYPGNPFEWKKRAINHIINKTKNKLKIIILMLSL